MQFDNVIAKNQKSAIFLPYIVDMNASHRVKNLTTFIFFFATIAYFGLLPGINFQHRVGNLKHNGAKITFDSSPYMLSTFNGHSMLPQCEYTLQRVHNQSSWTSTLNEVSASSQSDTVCSAALLFLPSTFCSTFLSCY